MLGKVELCLQEMGLRLVWSGEGMAVLKVKDSVLKLVDNSPHSGWLPYEHLTTLALLGKRNLAELLADGHVLFCPEVATSLLPQDSADPIFALEPLEDNRWCVRTSNLVGFLECNGLTISIGSRFDSEDGSSFFLPYLIARTLHIPPLELDWEQVSAYDLLPLLFPAALTRALGSGVFKQYQRVSTKGPCFKGSLAVAAHLKHNLTSGLVSGRASGRKVASVSSQLSADNDVTQLVRHTSVGGGRQGLQAGGGLIIEGQSVDEPLHILAADLVAAHKLLNLLIRLVHAGQALELTGAHRGLDRLAEHLPVGVELTLHHGRVRMDGVQASQQVAQRQQRIAERGADVALRGRIGQVALPAGFHQRGRKRVQQRAGQLEVGLGVLEADRIDLMRHGGGAGGALDRHLREHAARDVHPDIHA